MNNDNFEGKLSFETTESLLNELSRRIKPMCIIANQPEEGGKESIWVYSNTNPVVMVGLMETAKNLAIRSINTKIL